MKKIFTLPFIFLLLLGADSVAQHEECGTDISREDIQVIENVRMEMKNSGFRFQRGGSDSLIPVKFHVIGYDNGSGAIDSASVFDEIAIVNSYYINANIEFVHCGKINYINDADYVDFEKSVDETICDIHDVPDVVNIYFADNVYRITNGSTVSLCGYAYLSGSKNRVIMDNDCSTNGSTLAHELGHFFSLRHTHNSGDELVDGSNCATAGDLFCDTPADPQLSYSTVSTSCSYTGNDVDANGDTYAPNVRNIMSYSRKYCRDEFSNEQYAAMNYYMLTYRSYLDITPCYPSADFARSGSALFCKGDSINFTDNSTDDVISWNWYFPGGTPSSSTLENPTVVYDSSGTYDVSLVVENLSGTDSITKLANVNVQVCTGIDGAEDSYKVSAYPNPFTNTINLSLELSSNELVEVVLLDYLGRRVTEESKYNLPAGKHEIVLENSLSKGIYFLQVTAGANKKHILLSRTN